MTTLIEQLIAQAWNKMVSGNHHRYSSSGLDMGLLIQDGQVTSTHVSIPQGKRPEHIVILGKTGSGKSVLLRHFAGQDILSGTRGFVFFDLHGDATPKLLQLIAAVERRTNRDLSNKVIVIEPADQEFSVGLNVLERRDNQRSFVQIAEFAQILKQRWHLESFGARTEELLRNSLHVLSDSNLTLVEISPLLTNYAFRSACLRNTDNADIKEYFSTRYDRASEAMQSVLRDAILNKVTSFTSDPAFRHIIGQQHSSFSLVDAIDQGFWILLNLDKGRLGEQVGTLGSLFLTKIKNALFSRRTRQLFTLYCDEIQNLVTFDSGLDTLLSEARKFGISICSANQFWEQHSAQMRAAMMAVGSHVFFQLSSNDADKVSSSLDGGKSLAEILKNLPQRHMVIKSGHHRYIRAVVPTLADPTGDYSDLLNRCRARWAKRRVEVENEISGRNQQARRSNNEVLNEWK